MSERTARPMLSASLRAGMTAATTGHACSAGVSVGSRRSARQKPPRPQYRCTQQNSEMAAKTTMMVSDIGSEKRRGCAADTAPEKPGLAQLHPARQRIPASQQPREGSRDIQDGPRLQSQPAAGEPDRQSLASAEKRVDTVEAPIDHPPQLGRDRAAIEIGYMPLLFLQPSRRQVDAIEPAVVVLAILDMVQDLQRVAEGV